MKMIKTLSVLSLFLTGMAMLAQVSGFHYFDHKKLTDIQGQVLSIDFNEIYENKSAFLMLTIQSDDQRLFQVEVCPQWFFAADIAVGMKVWIRGSLLENTSGKFYLIAQEISLHGERIALRDSKGFPLWSRSGAGKENRRGAGGRGKR
jgi:hypothetical protein